MAEKKSAEKTTKGLKKFPPKISLTKKRLVIEYTDSHDLLDKLLTTTQAVSRFHSAAILSPHFTAGSRETFIERVSDMEVPDVIGPQRAYAIATDCSGETDLSKKLGDIPGLDLVIFQMCVQTGVRDAGYIPGVIPASSSTTLWEVVQAIQGCSK